jgi:hypothetical protein
MTIIRLFDTAPRFWRPLTIRDTTTEDVLREYDARLQELADRPLWPVEFTHSAPHDMWVLAFHESGHAVTALALGYAVEYVELQGRYRTAGQMQPTPETYREAPIADRVTIKLAGGEAEAQHYPPLTFDLEYERMDVYDISESRTLVAAHRSVELDAPVVAADLAIYRARAATLVAQHWRWVERVALSLAPERRLTGVQVLALRSQRA